MAGAAVVAVAGAAAFVVTGGSGDEGAACPGADGRSGQLRRCLSESLAFIETPLGVGSGILIEDGYVVTNAHVIDPFAAVDVSFAGGDRLEDIEVIGVDAAADIAVLGPVDVEAPRLALDPLPDFEETEEPDVFLVGYPGGIEADDPSVTLAGGLLSRIREDDTFGLTYLQTDAAIAGGQSGGALVDGDGNVLGVSGLGFADEFALVLSSDDVATAVDRIVAGDGDERGVVPTIDDAPSDAAEVELTVERPSVQMILPADESARDGVEVVVDGADDVSVFVSTFSGEPLGANEAGREFYEDEMVTFDDEIDVFEDPGMYDVDVLEERGEGRFVVDLPSGEDVIVSVERLERDQSVELSADVPFVVVDSMAQGGSIEIGTPVRGVVDGFAYEATYTVELSAGDEIAVTVRGGTSDAYFTVLAPGEAYDVWTGPAADDGGGGLYDLDPSDTYRAEEDGEHRIVVGTWDGVVGAYELVVEPAD